MATALLVGTNASAVDVASWAELEQAIQTPDAEINLTASVSMPAGEWDFNGATIICGNNKNNDFRVNAGTANGVYTLRNVTFKNYKYSSPKGAIYTTKAGTGIVLNLESSVHFEENKYDVCLYNNLTVNNEATINNIYLQRGGTINNYGVITTGVYGAGTGTGATTINNNAGASLTQTLGFKYAVTINNEVGGNAVVSGGTKQAAFTATNVTISGGTCNVAFNGTDVTINGGTFKGAISGTGYTITSGTFNVAPAAGTEGIINPGEYGYAKFAEGVGSLNIASGYAWRSYDQMVVRNDAGVVQVTRGGSSFTCLVEEAFANAQDGDKITLIEDVISYASLWVGTAEKTDAKISLTLDLNGHTLSSAKNVTRTITLTHGALYIKNSVPGQGGIYHARSNASGKSSEIIYVCGSPDTGSVNPRTAAESDLFVYLLIDEGVKLEADGNSVNGITVIENMSSGNTVSGLNYYTNVYSAASSAFSVAYGVRIDIKGTVNATKYAGKINGNIRHPNEMIHDYPGRTDAQIGDTANSTFFHIFPTAVMHTSDAVEATAVYSSGYGRWLIEGLCQGATGVYVKSGVVDLTNAVIESTYTGPASITTGKSSGVESVGYAVVVESNNHYTGQQAIVIGGDTKISTEATGGAAVIDVVDDTHESKVESIVINGGSFTGDNAIVISSETASENSTTVNGVTVTGEISVGGSTDPAAVAEIMGADTHTTVIENPDGTTTVVVSAGAAPTAATEWVDVAQLPAGSDAKWTGFVPGVIGNGTDAVTVSLGELQIISGNATDGVQELTIKDRATLKVDRLIMNNFARIIVEAGGKLIVEGEQGINAPVVDNILLKASEDKQALFLFNPAVQSNRHPSAKVEYHSNSFFSDHNIQQFFGIPTYNGGVTNIETTSPAAIYFDIWRNPGWDYVGAINVPVTPADPSVLDHLDKFNLPFALCCITSKNNIDNKPVFTFSGELTGNMDHSFALQKGWTSMANAYMGPIDRNAIIAQLAAWNANYGTEQSVYTYDLNAATGAIQWHARNKFAPLPEKGLNAMQPMMFHNGSKVEGIILDYSTLVWDPFVNASLAPARRQATNHVTQAQINIVGENEVDYITVVADSELENDRSFCAPKYDNAGLQLYVTGDEKYDVFAADVIENSYIGYRTVNAGMYTISFENVRGENLVLVDLVNGNRTNITEGAIYTFRADANESNDYRFQIVTPAKTPTSIDNTDAAANNKKAGVYTLTGQYLGNASVFNALPAGVYVVDGVKKVK